MIGLPSKDEMGALCVEARIQKWLEDNREELERGVLADMTGQIEALRISRDGKIKLVTSEEFEQLWQNQK